MKSPAKQSFMDKANELFAMISLSLIALTFWGIVFASITYVAFHFLQVP